MKTYFTMGVLIFFLLQTSAQSLHPSIHQEQQQYYSQFGEQGANFYDSLNRFPGVMPSGLRSECQLKKVVFGFHPYWAGSDYLNYQWNLLSDFCYFAYEVDPGTGGPVTCHDWLTDPAIDSAKANGIKVHLCATLFSGHNTFFTSLTSRQNLINDLVSLIQQRDADGVNMDIEAVPAYLGDSITAFMRDLSAQLKAALPLAKVSIDLPAVDWGNAFHIEELDPYIDLFFVMGYDYYWNGSSQAGPVSPLYSLTSGYDYSLSRTISAFESAGIRKGKFILGIPYYGRRWKTQSNSIPSQTLANGTALTYASIRNNGGIYNTTSYRWEPNSFSSCYIFFQNDSWNQCFIGLDHDLRKKYEIVNYRDLAGIGIWALGYDNGYPDLWQAISDKFSDCYIPLTCDTLYDSGGPTWNYYTGEEFITTVDHGYNDFRWLTFTDFYLEDGYDSLWLFAGPDTTYPLLGGFTGDADPGGFSSPNGAFTIRFKSDLMQNARGWTAVYHDGSFGMEEKPEANKNLFKVYPNPAIHQVNILIPFDDTPQELSVYDNAGRVVFSEDLNRSSVNQRIHCINLEYWPAGIYSVALINSSGQVRSSKIFKQ